MKLIASDLDGTLLNEQGEVSKENAEAIKKAIAQGCEFVVATGRSYGAANKPLQEVDITCPIISMNGARTYTSDKKIVRSVALDIEIARKIQNVCQEEEMYLEFFTNQGIYSTSREYFVEVMIDVMKSANPDVSEAEIREGAESRLQEEQVSFIENYDDLYAMENLEIFKILGFSLEKERLEKVRTQFTEKQAVAITSSGDINLEFNHPQAQKGIALEILASSMGVEMKDVMALGDNLNDVSMLKMAGHAVAMENAEEEIKKICDYRTKTNKEHGVAVAIEEVLGKDKH
ncbi:HAD family phosphatase [Virgibacillus sp. NKC19-16]|uniref:Cof-type HAD-IIB family hydrolase n=1 Tax=Virgibacillus salidurans TaxID=2831673 RepID=UPI001F252C9C|nr:Cof-type HAD-IIB family hydrolase [Virgibacillus sp. NKC19-16]UJL46292.1 HAD family phosphatase [Virgibacillus sp. NKC19-16]